MSRPPGGRGRLIAGLGALLMLLGSFLPWYRVGGEANGLPALSANAFDGAGIVVFVAAVAILALIVLPLAAGDLPLTFDRPAAFVAVTLVAAVGLALRAYQLWQLPALGLPDRAPGIWLAGAGELLAVWGTVRILQERGRP